VELIMAENSLLDLDNHLKALRPFLENFHECLDKLNNHWKALSLLLTELPGIAEDFSESCEDLMQKHERLMEKVKKFRSVL
jgi:hypothetical protein